MSNSLSAQILVIGSGAGGAVVADTLAQAGMDTLVLEEGGSYEAELETHSPEAMRRLYRNGGLTPLLGKPAIAFVEGRCLGGSTEVNSAFWHRTPADVLQRWKRDYGIKNFDPTDLSPYFEEFEAELGVSLMDANLIPRSSLKLKEGATKLGWSVDEIPRAQGANKNLSPFASGAKRSMSRTYLKRAQISGARVLGGYSVRKLIFEGDRAVGAWVTSNERKQRVDFKHVFVCAGAIQSARLLRASGVNRNVGNTLRIHPMLKVAAEFEEELNSHQDPLPVYQVGQFRPEMSFGGSVFSPGFLALLASENRSHESRIMQRWKHTAMYYTSSCGESTGTVRVFPGTGEALLRFALRSSEADLLRLGLERLATLLFAAGAKHVYPGIKGLPMISSLEELKRIDLRAIAPRQMSLSTVHSFSTCPMGERRDVCAADSFGRVFGYQNITLADASLIPDGPGVNPQGTVMAIAKRNACNYLKETE